jgi:hypothetical protein
VKIDDIVQTKDGEVIQITSLQKGGSNSLVNNIPIDDIRDIEITEEILDYLFARDSWVDTWWNVLPRKESDSNSDFDIPQVEFTEHFFGEPKVCGILYTDTYVTSIRELLNEIPYTQYYREKLLNELRTYVFNKLKEFFKEK